MAVAVPKLSSGAVVKIRYNSIDVGTTRWKEGTFEVLEKDNKVNLFQVLYNSVFPHTCSFHVTKLHLNHNVNNVVMQPIHTMRRIVVTLKDDSIVTLERVPPVVAEKMKEYLEKLKLGKSTVLKTSQGSASFGVLGNRSVKNETSPHGERQTTPRRPIVDNREETTTRKPLGSPSRVTSTPARSGLSENRCCHTFSSSTFIPPPPPPHTHTHRPSTTFQTTSAKRSLMLPNHSTPLKKVRPTLDYGGWNKPRPSTLAQPQPPLQGFSNLGNTCYMNAILQSLFSLPSFSNDLLKQGIPWKKIPFNALLRRFAHLLAKKDISCPEVKKDLLRRVKSAISSTAERFSGYMQNDAHEFLSQCLDQLKEDVEKMNKSWKSESAAAAWDEPPQQAAAARPGEEANTSRIYTCPVVVNMEFEVQHTITCKDCGEVVTKREQFNDLSIDLPRRKKTIPLRSIQDSLDLFFRIEEIEYLCEKCSGKVATVTHKFSRLPRFLILHLKRYSFNAQLSLNSKLGQQVMIPRYLTLLSHCTDATRPPLSLGWSANAAMKLSLKAGGSSSTILVDSDSEEELSRKVVSRKRRLSDCLPDDRVQRGVHHTDASDFNSINDEEMLAAVLEMSRQDAGLSCHAPEDEPTSSPDTGFGDADAQEMNYRPDLLETDTKPSADVLNSLDLTMDENKENQTPEGVQGDLDWVQQYGLEQEREEQELQQALAQSLQEHEAQEMREDDDLKRATELSLQEFNNSLPELLCSDEDSGNEEVLDMEYSEAETEDLKRNAESGDLANSFRLISVVSHIGSSSSSGHYISDVYDMKKQSWLTYNDLDVSRTQEATVQRDRDRSGYIFFYMHKLGPVEEPLRQGGLSCSPSEPPVCHQSHTNQHTELSPTDGSGLG
uniref:Ubiquitin carboxyl-terminal hydrolase n=1 Tax=Oncorhynchus kisutch TaxID=8019 RepID=A0A8C7FJW6_ONCKI